MVKVAIYGAAGRLGQRILALAHEDERIAVAAALEHAEHQALGADAGTVAGVSAIGLPLSSELPGEVDAAIDFSSPAGTRTALEQCVEKGCALVIGTTGLSEADHGRIDEAARSIPVLQAPNMSLGVNLLLELVGRVAQQLGPDYDIEIEEAHHRFKKDAPSGTAQALLEAICRETGKDPTESVTHGRSGEQPRRDGEIGVHAKRLGGVVGEHTVRYAGLEEAVSLGHTAFSRDVFARGALQAARWLAVRPPGRYTMGDVLG